MTWRWGRRNKRNVARALAAALVLASSLAAAPASAEPPRKPDGRPSIEGVWDGASLTPFERPADLPTLDVEPGAEPEVAAKLLGNLVSGAVEDPDITHTPIRKLMRVGGVARTSLLVEPADGRLPYSAAGSALLSALEERASLDDVEEAGGMDRCISGFLSPPLRLAPLHIPLLIVQTPDAVAIAIEDLGGWRVIDLAGAPPPAAVTNSDGWSQGRWDGDTLEVRTTHLSGRDPFRTHFDRPILVGPGSVVIERFTRLSKDEMLYVFTVEDPELYAAPWRAEATLTRDHGLFLEYACHEANYSLVNILKAARVADGTYRRAPSAAE
jgi:hypothetical protein